MTEAAQASIVRRTQDVEVNSTNGFVMMPEERDIKMIGQLRWLDTDEVKN